MSELGTGAQIVSAFRSGSGSGSAFAFAFASWLGLCPDNRISGGRILKAKTRKVSNRVCNAMKMGPMGSTAHKRNWGNTPTG